MPSYASYCPRIDPDNPHKNRIPGADANLFEATLGTLLVFYNAMRPDPIDYGLLQDSKAGMRSLDEAMQRFKQMSLLKKTLDQLSSGLGARLHGSILETRCPDSPPMLMR